ncbi:MAG: polyhydroxyalkanoate depolymerase [Mycobacteriales bacterium]
MLYTAYRANRVLSRRVRAASALTVRAVGALPPGMRERPSLRKVAAFHEVVANAKVTHYRPAFGIHSVTVDGVEVDVREEAVDSTPFGTLLHFAKPDGPPQPTVLLVAPLSGHFATMLTATARTLLRSFDVYITDWHNARDISVEHGPFGLDDYVEHLIRFLKVLGPQTSVVAVCQPAVPAFVATAVLAMDDDPAQPRSLTLMAGPIDTRVNPTAINATAMKRPLEWYRRRCLTTVPGSYPGAGRRVYPGFLQLSAFAAMNLRRHLSSHAQLYRNLVAGDTAAAAATQAFYNEYFAVLDMPAEFYLDTVSAVFQQHLLPKGELTYRGRRVDPSAIRRTALLTVEAELDDMCAVGQTVAAHNLATGLTEDLRARHVQPGVGHYGIFAGSRWENEVFPVVRDFIETRAAETRAAETRAAETRAASHR